MSGKNGKPVKGHHATRIELEFALLRSGSDAASWAAREYLGLDGEPTIPDVIQAVHRALHAANGEKNQTRKEESGIAAINAGRIVLELGVD